MLAPRDARDAVAARVYGRAAMLVSPTGLDALETFCSTSLDAHLAEHAAMDAGQCAIDLFQQAARRVPAYARFVAERGVDVDAVTTVDDFVALPTVTKAGYLTEHRLEELCFDGVLDACDTVAVSSGSTGTPTYFPRSVRHEAEVAWRFEQVFRDTFDAHTRRTLALVCFPLGTWVGGMFTAACCRQLALKGYRLMVVTVGNQPAEILRAVRELGPSYEQLVLLGYPPFLKDVIDAGIADGLDWRRQPLCLVLAGEVVSEAWRDIVMERTGARDPLRFAAALYGTADAGVLGVETMRCTAIRRFCASHPDAAMSLFGQRRLPTLVQYDPVDRYFEQDGTSLLFTGAGGGIPLVRYAIGDSGGVLGFAEMEARLAELGLPGSDHAVRSMPFAFVFGRAHHAVSFYGANVFVETVRLGLEQPEVSPRVSGKLVMQVVEDEAANARLVIVVELGRGEQSDPVLASRIATAVRDAITAASSEYRSYVPAARQLPEIVLCNHHDPQWFPVGVKHQYVRRA